MDDLAEVTCHNSWPGQEMTEGMSDPADLKEDKFTNRIAWIPSNTVVPRTHSIADTHSHSIATPKETTLIKLSKEQ